MKTVKIPDCMNPFEVIVNNKRYSFPGGTTQEVPDEVAEVIDVHMKNHADMTAPPYAPGGGGATCKLKLTANDDDENGYVLYGEIYLPGVDTINIRDAIGTSEYMIPCGSIIVFNCTNAYPSTASKMTALMNGDSSGAWIYRVEANPGETAELSMSAYC